MIPQITNLLSWWQWAALAAVPPAIIALYFLKLKRQPVEVPSTYLWRKSIEDLHVNSLWQKLRQSLLLFLQLLLVLVAFLALLRPMLQGEELSGERYIFLIDTSASMAATDVPPSRLADAKRQVAAMIDAMKPGEAAMIVSFSDEAKVEQGFTRNKNELLRGLERIVQTNRPTALMEALRVASGLANPGRRAFDTTDTQVADALPATIFILSDGRFEPVKGFSLGNLEPKYLRIGVDEPENVAIAAFSSRRNDEKPGQMQAFARIENFGPADVEVGAELLVNGQLADARRVKVAKGEASGTVFELTDIEAAELELRIDAQDHLAVDDRAWAAINTPRRSKVLFITPGNEPFELALGTGRARTLAEVTVQPPEFLKAKEYPQQVQSGEFDLIIYDRCSPEKMPMANTLFIGRLPPGEAWTAQEKTDLPQIIDTDRGHPLMQMIEMGDVAILQGTPLAVPPGGTVLIDSHVGPMFVIAPRASFEDAVLGFEFIGADQIGTNWPVKLSFPVFMLNVLRHLGGGQDPLAAGSVRPGQAVLLRSEAAGDSLTVETPSRQELTAGRGDFNTFNFSQTEQVGLYRVQDRDEVRQRFAVNLFDSAESNIRPEPVVEIGWQKTTANAGWETTPIKAWKLLLLLALAVLLFEWYIYNRRVYL
jgi:hypothetical protein